MVPERFEIFNTTVMHMLQPPKGMYWNNYNINWDLICGRVSWNLEDDFLAVCDNGSGRRYIVPSWKDAKKTIKSFVKTFDSRGYRSKEWQSVRMENEDTYKSDHVPARKAELFTETLVTFDGFEPFAYVWNQSISSLDRQKIRHKVIQFLIKMMTGALKLCLEDQSDREYICRGIAECLRESPSFDKQWCVMDNGFIQNILYPTWIGIVRGIVV